MSRPPLPLGQRGTIRRTQLAPGRWVAKARVRDFDGVTRLIERRTPNGVKDDTGNKAEQELIKAIGQRTTPTVEEVTADSRLSFLWEARRLELSGENKATRTMDRYDYVAGFITEALGNVRVREATTQRLDAFLRALTTRRGAANAKTARSVLSGMFNLAIRYGALASNPIRDVSTMTGGRTKAARALTVDELRAILRGVTTSTSVLPPVRGAKRATALTIREYAARVDLPDVVTMLAATGCRISEVLGLRWSDIDLDAKTATISGKVIRAKGAGLIREAYPKTEAVRRTLPLPAFAVAMLMTRQVNAEPNPHDVVFPSSTGTLRDVDNTLGQWNRVRDVLGFDWVTTHTFRRTLATIIDAEGMSARIGADQLGHRQISMTQDKYMGRGKTHTEVADLLDRKVTGQPRH